MVIGNPFLNANAIASLRQTYADGMATVQEWNGVPELTFTRQGGGGAGVVTVISVKLRNAIPLATGEGTPVEMITRKGDIKLFAFDIPSGKTIRQGDRFAWNGLTCIVEAEPIEQLLDSDVLRIPFEVEDNP